MCRFIPITLFFTFAFVLSGNAGDDTWASDRGQEVLNQLRAAMSADAREFYSPKLHAWYSTRLTNLPGAADVIDLYPNPVGYGTGMDDNPLFNGVVLVALVDLYHLTQSDDVRREAFDLYSGLKLCGSAHGIPGFVSRGISIEDGKSTYITSSRDQYTHYVDGLWQYYHSPMCDSSTKIEIRTLLSQLADTMKREITAENDYGFLRADGSKDPRGLHKMWHVYPHEAARLPMIYAAAWDVTGNDDYYKLYRKYLIPSLDQSITLKTRPQAEVNAWVPPYSFFQMQCSLALLYRLEKVDAVKAKIFEAMLVAKQMAESKFAWGARTGLRNLSELFLAATIIEDLPVTDAQRSQINFVLDQGNLKKGWPTTTLHQFALYAKACRAGLLPIPKSFPAANWVPLADDSLRGVPSDVKPTVRQAVPSRHDPNLVVFISDCHVGSLVSETDSENAEKSRQNLDHFNKTCEMILALKPLPSVVIVTGDLASVNGLCQDYLAAAPMLKRFQDAGIDWRICPGDTDRRISLNDVFPQIKGFATFVPSRLTQIVSTDRTDFLLLDSLNEGVSQGSLDVPQRQWLEKQIEQYRQSGRRFFIVSHHPAGELDILPLLKDVPSCCGCLSAHTHSWSLKKEGSLSLISLHSSTYPTGGKATRHGFAFLKMDAWEYILRPVTFDQDDVWERQSRVLRFPKNATR